MKGVVPPDLVDKKISEALLALKPGLPAAPMARLVESALRVARGRIKHLEQRLGETETLRDRIAMQLLPSILSSQNLSTLPTVTIEDRIRLAYYQADKVLEIRAQGSAEAPGETTSPEIPVREYKVGDQFKLRGEMVTIDEVMTSPGHPSQYSWVFPKGRGGEGCYTAAEIAKLQANYGDV